MNGVFGYHILNLFFVLKIKEKKKNIEQVQFIFFSFFRKI